MKQDERCTRCGGEIFPNAGEQWPDGWIHSEPNNCYLTALARAEAAEALAYERLENMLFAEQRAADADLRAEAAEAEAADAILAASAAAQREENAMHALSHFRARVAELEAQLAAQQWRPVTEDWPPYGVQHLGRAFLNSPTLLVTRIVYEGGKVWQDDDGLLFAGEIRFCAAIPPTSQEPTP